MARLAPPRPRRATRAAEAGPASASSQFSRLRCAASLLLLLCLAVPCGSTEPETPYKQASQAGGGRALKVSQTCVGMRC